MTSIAVLTIHTIHASCTLIFMMRNFL